MNTQERVAIIGGEGKWGKKTTELFHKLGHDVVISDPKSEIFIHPVDAIRQSQIIFFSVLPVEEIDNIITEAGQDIRSGQVVMDNASVKTPFASSFRNLAERGVSVCSTHPMCAPEIDLIGQKSLIMRVGTSSQKAECLAEKLFQSGGMVTIPFDFEQHDKAMTTIQALPHLVMRSVGLLMSEEGLGLEDLLKIASPNFELFNTSLQRVLNQSPEISATIINSAARRQSGKAFAEHFIECIERVLSMDKNEMSNAFAAANNQLKGVE